MKASDTIMSNLADAVLKHTDLPMGQAIAIAQAEISFKAGIKEYHRFMKTPCSHYIASHYYTESPCKDCYDAKLKEWGIVP